jgi:putative FmdB family regulatory protein
MPLFDFRCSGCNHCFEDLAVANADGVPPLPCPHCGNPARQVWLRSPGISCASWVVKFGGNTFDADDFDARVDRSLNRTRRGIEDRPDFKERFLEKFDANISRHFAGELPPPKAPDASIAADLTSSITKEVS